MHERDFAQRRARAVDGLDRLGVTIGVVEEVPEGFNRIEEQAADEEGSQTKPACGKEPIDYCSQYAGTGAEKGQITLTLGAQVQGVLLEIEQRGTQAGCQEEKCCDQRCRPQAT